MFRSSGVIYSEFYDKDDAKRQGHPIFVIAPGATGIEYPALAGAATGQDDGVKTMVSVAGCRIAPGGKYSIASDAAGTTQLDRRMM
jgi:hypothetical protein